MCGFESHAADKIKETRGAKLSIRKEDFNAEWSHSSGSQSYLFIISKFHFCDIRKLYYTHI